jgi:hypothetical protein
VFVSVLRCQQVKKIYAHFLPQGAKNRAFRSNLFCGRAAKKDFRFNPSRPTG